MLRVRECIVLAALIGITFSPVSHAATATDGSLGTTSTGTVPVTLTMPAVVKISGLQEVSLTYTQGVGGDLTDSQNFCVYTNTPGGAYSLTISDTGKSTTDFQLSAASDSGAKVKAIPYEVFFGRADVQPAPLSPNPLDQVQPAKPISAVGANTVAIDCGATMVATLKVVIPEASLAAVEEGTYTDTLTLLVAPESK